MLPSVESTHCTYGIFIHAVGGAGLFPVISAPSRQYSGKKMAFYTTVLLEFQNNIPFPVVFLHFCFINIVFHHPYVPHRFYHDPHHLLPCWNKRCQ